jgi:hypothetical protein
MLLYSVLSWFLFFHVLFFISLAASPYIFSSYIALDPASKAYWADSMVSTIHAIVIVALACRAWIACDVWNTVNLHVSTPESLLANSVFIGYLGADLFLVLIYNSKWPGWQATTLHHASGVLFYFVTSIHSFAHPLGICTMLTEITTPFVNQRFFFDKGGMKSSPLYLINGILMTVLWFVFRILLFCWIGWRIWIMRVAVFALPTFHSLVLFYSYGVGFLLQIFWFRKIMKGVIKALKKDKGKTA